MYLGVDIGGSKTLIAVLSDAGVIKEKIKFETPKKYDDFLDEVEKHLRELSEDDFRAAGVAMPGRVDLDRGVGLTFGNLPWEDVPIQADFEKLLHCPVVIENDAKLAGLSEAMLLKEHQKVLYVTISTGIGMGVIIDQIISPAFSNSEGGHMMLEYHGKLQKWESFASGHAIVERFGKKAQDIDDAATWQRIAHDLSLGFIELIAIVQPDVIVIGGSVGVYLDRFGPYLEKELKRFHNPMIPIPPIRKAERPEEAVVFGCYDLARSTYGTGR